eukprot:m.207218 g.207218  ORF g.207218 m.207218 type:complete len:227 (+) comp39693_c0_seq1:250-930(+)
MVLSECSRAVDAVSVSMSRGQSLHAAFPALLGDSVSSDQLRKVAKEIAKEVAFSGPNCCSLVAHSLHIKYSGKGDPLDDITEMLHQWKEERRSGAMLAVLVDALEDCGLDRIVNTLPPRPRFSQEFSQTTDMVVVNRDIMDIVCKYADADSVPPFGRRLLNMSNAQVKNEITGIRRPSEQMYAILEKWLTQEGEDATLDKLLLVCHHTVNIGGAVTKDLKTEGHLL